MEYLPRPSFLFIRENDETKPDRQKTNQNVIGCNLSAHRERVLKTNTPRAPLGFSTEIQNCSWARQETARVE
jgi:hypothetical protein